MCHDHYSAHKEHSKICSPIQTKSTIPLSIPFDTLKVLSGTAEVQNFREGSVNPEKVRVGGLNTCLLQSSELDTCRSLSVGQSVDISSHAHPVLVRNIWVLGCIGVRSNGSSKATNHIFVQIKPEMSKCEMFIICHVEGICG